MADNYADGGGLDIEVFDAMAQLERPVYGGIGIHGNQKILNEKIERPAVDLEA